VNSGKISHEVSLFLTVRFCSVNPTLIRYERHTRIISVTLVFGMYVDSLRADCKNTAQISTQLRATPLLSLHSTSFHCKKILCWAVGSSSESHGGVTQQQRRVESAASSSVVACSSVGIVCSSALLGNLLPANKVSRSQLTTYMVESTVKATAELKEMVEQLLN